MSYNRLGREASPYLRQHADNPVHWWPWCEEAFVAARRLDRPVLLSIGYAACHWCHVMAHESFADEKTAAVMNAWFVNIKVDREERPDIDRQYMQALQAMGEHGGWPLTMFLTPDGEPFWGGTYFPPEPRHGRPAFADVLREVARVWKNDRQRLLNSAGTIDSALRRRAHSAPARQRLPATYPATAARAIASHFDPHFGGLDTAPKFPQVPLLELLWHAGGEHERGHVLNTLRHICQGGIYDHLGGGFARYSTDEQWLVPHFEKMLYDNALLLSTLARAWLATGEDLFRERIEETVAFLQRRMHIPGAGLASSLDADSEGEEGRYYIWSYRELKQIVSKENRKLFCRAYGVSPGGNWNGAIILNRLRGPFPLSPEQEAALRSERQRLLKHRQRRPRPARDDKVLCSWNGLAISALAEAAFILRRPQWLQWAEELFSDVVARLEDGDGLRQSWLGAPSAHAATADGPANMIAAALRLHAATGRRALPGQAQAWAEHMFSAYWRDGLFTFSRTDIHDLRRVEAFGEDDATPNYNATMVQNLRHLAFLTGEEKYREAAQGIITRLAPQAMENPIANAGILFAAREMRAMPQAIVFHGNDSRETFSLFHALVRHLGFMPDVIHAREERDIPATHAARQHVKAGSGLAGPALLLCRGQTCTIPIGEEKDIPAALSILGLQSAPE